ncbi:hypothetical protein Rsub_10871 [Raphidocelis subcapitata]|nr:hypothetical protein Rsub_10871 [Raphidocelis subcapitata]|eukprot:GBF98124.1 hypothetical protein Rsub_10871 [Raphidocelis subcapitata]
MPTTRSAAAAAAAAASLACPAPRAPLRRGFASTVAAAAAAAAAAAEPGSGVRAGVGSTSSSGANSSGSSGAAPAPVPLKYVVQAATRRWFEETLAEARNGDVKQQALVAQMLQQGYGTDRDPAAAARWADKARRRGYRMNGVYCEL